MLQRCFQCIPPNSFQQGDENISVIKIRQMNHWAKNCVQIRGAYTQQSPLNKSFRARSGVLGPRVSKFSVPVWLLCNKDLKNANFVQKQIWKLKSLSKLSQWQKFGNRNCSRQLRYCFCKNYSAMSLFYFLLARLRTVRTNIILPTFDTYSSPTLSSVAQHLIMVLKESLATLAMLNEPRPAAA